MPTYTAQELTRILSQPGYAITCGSSLPTQLPTVAADGAQREISMNLSSAPEKTLYGRSVGF